MPFFSGRCNSKARLDSKTAVITGCNTGIGKETALDFYKRGARVIMACRDLNKAGEAQMDIETKCKALDSTTLGVLKVVKLDLGSLKSVRECAQLILETEPEVNILVNNAGVMMCPLMRTEDGFEMQIGTNHLGHFLFTLLLLPRIRKSVPARIVNVASLAHTLHAMDFHDLNYENKWYMSTVAYSRSKVANILFTRELTARLKEHKIEGINTYSLHPGVIETELSRHLDKGLIFGAQWVWSKFKWLKKTPELGAQTTIYCSVDENCANETGLYYSDCVPVKPAKHARREHDAKTLWEMSMQLVKLENFDPFTAEDPGVKL